MNYFAFVTSTAPTAKIHLLQNKTYMKTDGDVLGNGGDFMLFLLILMKPMISWWIYQDWWCWSWRWWGFYVISIDFWGRSRIWVFVQGALFVHVNLFHLLFNVRLLLINNQPGSPGPYFSCLQPMHKICWLIVIHLFIYYSFPHLYINYSMSR